MKKIFAIALAAVMACGIFAGCGERKDNGGQESTPAGGSSASGSAVEAIKANGKLVMYTNAAFPPFEYLSDETSEAVGVDVDIAQAIADELGVKLVVENVDFDSIVPSIQAGKGDIGAAGMTVTDERKKSVDFSDTYATSIQYIIVPEETEVKSVEDLAGMAIGVQTGTTGDSLINGEVNGYEDDDGNAVQGVLQDTGAEEVQYKSALEATQDLLNGRINAVVIDKMPAEALVAKNDGLKCVELVYADGSKTEESYGICVAKDSDLLDVVNKVIKQLQDDGKIDEFMVNHSNS
ncbi:transporter substrate-binding domain-containing protein [Massiliimalia massiliensis]|uniref:transporter substrate-binding domain-containing protein n=1 Tax=Massiliimalia massiliensis TaxID=1852384 RepID=UPI000985A606|nr:transporter substrate-binding domain-containing protein [Massiliimalia massiliensis]